MITHHKISVKIWYFVKKSLKIMLVVFSEPLYNILIVYFVSKE